MIAVGSQQKGTDDSSVFSAEGIFGIRGKPARAASMERNFGEKQSSEREKNQLV